MIAVRTDSAGRVTMLQAYAVRMNELATLTAIEAQKRLQSADAQSVSIPLGAAQGIPFLSALGPQIPVHRAGQRGVRRLFRRVRVRRHQPEPPQNLPVPACPGAAGHSRRRQIGGSERPGAHCRIHHRGRGSPILRKRAGNGRRAEFCPAVTEKTVKNSKKMENPAHLSQENSSFA